jgi:hypothetical protein
MSRDKVRAIRYYEDVQTIELTTTCVCASQDAHKKEYVIYTGGIAGMTESATLERNPEPLKRRPDEVELNRD